MNLMRYFCNNIDFMFNIKGTHDANLYQDSCTFDGIIIFI